MSAHAGLKIKSRVYTEECIIESGTYVFKRLAGVTRIPFWLERVVVEGEFGWQSVLLQTGIELETEFKKKMTKLIEES